MSTFSSSRIKSDIISIYNIHDKSKPTGSKNQNFRNIRTRKVYEWQPCVLPVVITLPCTCIYFTIVVRNYDLRAFSSLDECVVIDIRHITGALGLRATRRENNNNNKKNLMRKFPSKHIRICIWIYTRRTVKKKGFRGGQRADIDGRNPRPGRGLTRYINRSIRISKYNRRARKSRVYKIAQSACIH